MDTANIMPVTSEWGNEKKTVYRFTIAGAWTLEEFLEKHRQLHQDFAAVTCSVIMILDLRRAKLLTGVVIQAGQVAFAIPLPTLELTVIISNHRAWQIVGQGLLRLFKTIFPWFTSSHVWVSSEEAARDVIEQYWRNH